MNDFEAGKSYLAERMKKEPDFLTRAIQEREKVRQDASHEEKELKKETQAEKGNHEKGDVQGHGKHWEGEIGFTTFGPRNVVDWSLEKEVKAGTVFLASGTFDEFRHEIFGLGQAGVGKITRNGQRVGFQFGASEAYIPAERHGDDHEKDGSKKSQKGHFELHPVATVSGLQPLGKRLNASGFATLNLNTVDLSRANANLQYKANDQVSFRATADTVFGLGGDMQWTVKETSDTEIKLMVTGTTKNPLGFGLIIRKK